MKKICLFCILLSIQIASGRPMRSMLGGLGAELVDELAHPLPDGVFAVEYIESTGTQYINTGIPYNSYTDEINCTIEVTKNVQYGYAFGCNESINGRARFFGVRRYVSNNEW